MTVQQRLVRPEEQKKGVCQKSTVVYTKPHSMVAPRVPADKYTYIYIYIYIFTYILTYVAARILRRIL